MHENSLITIGITCFNASETISRAIDSALSQTWPNLEILITDDCSTDRSFEILHHYQSIHKNIRILTNEKNKGVAFNRQQLLNQANGRYLAFFDDDDWSFPDRLEKQMERLQSYSAKVGHENIFCYGDRILIKGGDGETSLPGIGREKKEPHGLMVADMILGDKKIEGYSWGLLGTGTMLAPVEMMRALGGFDPLFRRSAEIDLAIRAVIQCDVHFISVPQPVIKQYFTPTPDKNLWKVGKYQLKMIIKHWRLVLRRGLVLRAAYPYTRYLKRILVRQASS